MKFANRLHLTQMYCWIHVIFRLIWPFQDASDLNKVENLIVVSFDPVSRRYVDLFIWNSIHPFRTDSLDRYDVNVLMTTPDYHPCSANGHCTPPLIMSHKFVLRGTKLDMISIIWLFILLIIELQIMATNRNILLYLICNWKTERPDSILDLRYKPRDTINIYWIWTAVLLASF